MRSPRLPPAHDRVVEALTQVAQQLVDRGQGRDRVGAAVDELALFVAVGLLEDRLAPQRSVQTLDSHRHQKISLTLGQSTQVSRLAANTPPEVEVDDVTCLVGKNEADKSVILQALHALHPSNAAEPLTLLEEYPRWLKREHEVTARSGTPCPSPRPSS